MGTNIPFSLHFKYIWLLKMKEILTLIKSIADYIQEDIMID